MLCLPMYMYSSYRSSEPACTIINAETAQYKGKVFIGTILLPLEAADSYIMKTSHISSHPSSFFFFLIDLGILIAGYQPCLQLSHYLSR